MATVGSACIRIQSLPAEHLWQSVVDMLDSQGLNGLYNFVHVPIDGVSGKPEGYAVVNMVSERVAELALLLLQAAEGEQPLLVEWNDIQGIDNLIEMVRDSDLMHREVPDKYKPVLFTAGNRIQFPEPTSEIQQLPLFMVETIVNTDHRNVDIMMVARHTFVEVVDDAEVTFTRRRRCFTDSEIIGAKCDDFDFATCSGTSDSGSEDSVESKTSADQMPTVRNQTPFAMWLPVSCAQVGHAPTWFNQCCPPPHSNRLSNASTKRAERTLRRGQRVVSNSKEKHASKVDKSCEKRTTLLLRNIPGNVDKHVFLDMLNEQGFSGLYNFVHVQKTVSGEFDGFAYVNLISGHVAELATQIFGAFDGWKTMLDVCWCDDYQGMNALEKKFVNDVLNQ